MRQFLFLIFSFLTVYLSGQIIGFQLDGGTSRLLSNQYNPLFATQKSYYMPYGQAGIFYETKVRSHEIFGAELLCSQFNGRINERDTSGYFVDANGNKTIIINNLENSYHIMYLSLPIHYGIIIKKISISIGLQPSVTLNSWGESTFQSNFVPITNTIGQYTSQSKIPKLYIKDGALGEIAKLVYHFNETFSFEGGCYYGLSNIYRHNNSGITAIIWKLQMATIGIRIHLWNFKNISTKKS